MPLIRTTYECAITAHWVAQSPDAAGAVMNEERRQRINHASTMLKAHPTFTDQAAAVAAVIDAEVDTSSSARTFQGICDDLVPGGHQGYMIYRALSHLSHATVLVADQYLEGTQEEPGMALGMEPLSQPDAVTWAGMVARCFVWAGNAVDYMSKDRPRRSELRAAARRLGIKPDLHLTPEAQLRQSAGRP